jgi:hypothetical protein
MASRIVISFDIFSNQQSAVSHAASLAIQPFTSSAFLPRKSTAKGFFLAANQREKREPIFTCIPALFMKFAGGFPIRVLHEISGKRLFFLAANQREKREPIFSLHSCVIHEIRARLSDSRSP